MDIHVEQGRAEKYPCELLLLFSFDSPDDWEGPIRTIDSEWKGFLSNLMKQRDFNGELYQCQLLYTQGALPAQRVLLTGLGKKEEFDLEKWRGASAKAGRYIRDSGLKRFASPIRKLGGFSEEQLADAFVTGLLLGVYQFNELKTLDRDKIKEIEEGVLLGETAEEIKEIEKGLNRAGLFRNRSVWRGISSMGRATGLLRWSWLRRPKRFRKKTGWSFRCWI